MDGTRFGGMALAAVIISTGIGCGSSSSGGGGGSFSTSVPSSSKVNTLSPSQSQQLCNDLSSYTQRQLKNLNLCQGAAVLQAASDAMSDTTLTDSALQAGCSQYLTFCNAVLSGGFDGGTTTTTCDTSTCTATVGQVTACVNDDMAAAQAYFQMLPSCSMVTRARLMSVNPDAGPPTPASCSSLPPDCQNLSSQGTPTA
jgi:hypothetical protein